jgi:signal transduction histidine kinase
MSSTGSSSRRLFVLATVFGLFVLFDIALFGWLIERSLSQRELEKILLETRSEAQDLADRIAGRAQEEGKDLYTAIALERETQTYIDSVLRQRDIVQTVEIRDRNGVLVFRSRSEASLPLPGSVAPSLSRELPPQTDKKTSETLSNYDVAVPIADLGVLHIGISRSELEHRIEVLRADLTRQASFVGAVTVALLLSAYLFIWWLWRRGQRLEAQAAEAERMAYVGGLASGLAHEIRNPLNSLNLNMQLLEEEERDLQSAGSSRRRLLAITRSEIQRLERLVSDFLSYARPRPLELESVPAVELLEHCLEVLAGEIEARGARVEIEDRADGARVRVDRAQMGQLLLNLAQNALAATHNSGRPPLVRLICHRHGGRIALEVADNGVGIPPKELEKIFELFYSTRKGGTGLGLAIVQRIARAHDAELAVQSTVGEGTSIAVSLPAVPESERRPAGDATASATAERTS